MKIRTLIAALAVLAACGVQAETDGTDGAPSPSVTMVGDTAVLELPVGRSANNGEFEITFDAVTEDSRCPSDVQCVWAGNSGIRLTLDSGDDSQVSIINSTLTPHSAAFMGYVITFRDLIPHPTSEAPIDRAAYVARIGIVDTR